MTFADELQIAGWLLTVVGQIQVALKQRKGSSPGSPQTRS